MSEAVKASAELGKQALKADPIKLAIFGLLVLLAGGMAGSGLIVYHVGMAVVLELERANTTQQNLTAAIHDNQQHLATETRERRVAIERLSIAIERATELIKQEHGK